MLVDTDNVKDSLVGTVSSTHFVRSQAHHHQPVTENNIIEIVEQHNSELIINDLQLLVFFLRK